MITRKTAAALSPLLLAGVAALTLQGCAGTPSARPSPQANVLSATAPTAQAPTAQPTTDSAPLYDFIDLPPSRITADRRAHEFVVSYRNTTPHDRTVAPQILMTSADSGPFLAPSDIRLEHLDRGTDRWRTVPLGTQTGTLYTAIPAQGRLLQRGDRLVEHYRLTVAPAGTAAARHGTLLPRIVVYRVSAAQAPGTPAANR